MEVSNSTYGYQCSAVSTGRRGRPRFSISQDQLEYLTGNDFPVQRIASMLGVSASTVRRRMTDFGLSISDTYTCISDEDLCSAILDIKKNSPNSGYRFVWSHFKAGGIKVPIHRVRLLCHRMDPIGVVTRWMAVVERRTYKVPGPNSLWHIDGNHKLIRYAFSTFYGIPELIYFTVHAGGAWLFTVALMASVD